MAIAWRLRSSASCTSPGKIDHRGVARRRQRRRLGAGIVADERDHAAVLGRAGEHTVADRVTRPIEPGRLGVPHADHTVVRAIGQRARQLAAHHRGGRQLLVGAGLAHDRELLHGTRRALDLVTERTDRRALVARHERSRVQATAAVEANLVEWEAGDRLEAGEEDSAVLEAVSIGQLVFGELGLLDHVGH
jgi:hypothetical protein